MVGGKLEKSRAICTVDNQGSSKICKALTFDGRAGTWYCTRKRFGLFIH